MANKWVKSVVGSVKQQLSNLSRQSRTKLGGFVLDFCRFRRPAKKGAHLRSARKEEQEE